MKYIKLFERVKAVPDEDLKQINIMFKPLGVVFKNLYEDSTVYCSIKFSLSKLTILYKLVQFVIAADYNGTTIRDANFLIFNTSMGRLVKAHDAKVTLDSYFMNMLIVDFLGYIKLLSDKIIVTYKSGEEYIPMPFIKDVLIHYTEYVLNNKKANEEQLNQLIADKILEKIKDLPNSFKILNTIKQNDTEFWKRISEDEKIKMGGEMGGLGF